MTQLVPVIRKTKPYKKTTLFAGAVFATGLMGVLLVANTVSGEVAKSEVLEKVVAADNPRQVRLEDLTFAEVAYLVKSGYDRVIIPTGGTEQNGYHMVLGKHNFVVRHTSEQIARKAGRTLVAPVLPYVPEGGIDPPTGHMKFAGTLSLPEPVFASVLEHTARSLKAHGFKYVFFLGDSGGNQAAQEEVAAKLSKEWSGEGIVVRNLSKYYAENGQEDYLQAKGENSSDIGSHAGMRDTSEVMFVREGGVRKSILANRKDYPTFFWMSGYTGAPDRASKAYGKAMIALKVQAAVKQMNEIVSQQRLAGKGVSSAHLR